MSVQPIHSAHHAPIARTRNAVASALPAGQRMDFYLEMGEASPEQIGQVLTRWRLLLQVAADPATAATAVTVKAGTASGRGATAVLRELHHSGTSQAPGRTL
ncbi:hypothetical protein [Streptacidiphilus albus]|uniref:hypothetical protein n=1 Tax=Streptacidiphilus albus TaxID=105425 RepID=UPI00054C4098|nr:hypothetical protein [Streptacidiphilus albus]